MKYVIDHDYHLHSYISQCSSDPEQTPERILQYAKEKGLKRVILTDHFWDESVRGASNWYATYHKYSDISKFLPLPVDPEVEFLFGCETDMDKNGVIGISKERCDSFDFIIVSTTHLHMKGFTLDEALNDKENAEKYSHIAISSGETPERLKTALEHYKSVHSQAKED